ncbi:HesA/MoeB/ThiF family protein [Methanobacterium alcaliphilum]|uniref:HesA/MoeB/ThiF family protein n=1 Tax=Methanobacterium alcaliphilum TaxID=392018 RepID=UPI00200ACB67|nr:HesA/MoeB/ThiF family protein [Methanobacterium alcaliphilum]MCK9151940.1 HesA/MoeB/ThiF family protein [Methanobacterium alcaliphilum]
MPKRYEGMAYWEIVSRQMSILTKSQQQKLKDATITVIGCGGIGGSAIEMLARMGIGNLRIVDKDSFDVSNINRQVMSSFCSVGKSKIRVTEKTLRSINPFINIKSFEVELDETNVEKIMKGSDLVIDALDNLLSRIIVSRYAFKMNIPFIHGAIHGTMGQITVFNNNTPKYEELFKLPSFKKELNEEIIENLEKLSSEVPPVLGSVPNIVGCIQASEALKIITGKGESILAPKVLNFDLMRADPFSMVEF